MKKITILALVAFLQVITGHAGTVRGGEIVVAAPASLTDVLPDIRQAYRDKSRDKETIAFTFASSGDWYRQLQQGAGADVYISANGSFMDKAGKKGLIDRRSRRLFAGNKLLIAVPDGNPARIDKLHDLSSPRVTRIALGAPETVPAGQYARKALQVENLWKKLRKKYIYARDVRSVLALLQQKEADAGFIYKSDARIGAGETDVIELVDSSPPVRYWAAVTSKSGAPQSAADFVNFLTTDKTVAILKQHGFSPGN